MHRHNGQKLDDEQAHIRQSIHDILLTPIGSRIMRRDYGSYIYALLDKPISRTLMLQLSAAAVIALKKWEPRIEINRFAVEIEPQQAQINAQIDYVRKENKQKFTINDVILGIGNERIS